MNQIKPAVGFYSGTNKAEIVTLKGFFFPVGVGFTVIANGFCSSRWSGCFSVTDETRLSPCRVRSRCVHRSASAKRFCLSIWVFMPGWLNKTGMEADNHHHYY